MPKYVPSLKPKELIRLLEAAGCSYYREGRGDHRLYMRVVEGQKRVVPIDMGTREFSPVYVLRIFRQFGLTDQGIEGLLGTGEALDSLTSQLAHEETGTLVIVQSRQPDRFFDVRQQQRLSDLMKRWRAARDQGRSLPPGEQTELAELVDSELRASAARAEAMVTSIEIPTPQANPAAERNPWLDTAGLFADDSTLEPMLQKIYAERAAERLKGPGLLIDAGGRFYLRAGREKRDATGRELMRIAQAAGELHYDESPVLGTTLADLSLTAYPDAGY